MMSTLRAYAAPIFIFFLAMFFQLFLLPRSFPPSHYDVLGVTRHCSAEEVREAYESFESKWDSGSDVPTASNFIKIRYAYELLTNPIWKRDYDLYDVDEKAHVIEELERQYAAEDFAKIKLPLLEVVSYEPQSERFIKITSQDFASKLQDSKPLLIQMYSSGSSRSAQFSQVWERIVELLEGVANHGMVELGDLQLVTYLAEKKPTGKVFFRKGLPSLVAFPPHCKTSDCLIRFEGEPSAEAVTDWLATTVMGLPRIFYQSKETLVSKFLSKVPPYKVKVILFSKTGERATTNLKKQLKKKEERITLLQSQLDETIKKVRMLGSGTEKLEHLLTIRRTDSGHVGLGYTGGSANKVGNFVSRGKLGDEVISRVRKTPKIMIDLHPRQQYQGDIIRFFFKKKPKFVFLKTVESAVRAYISLELRIKIYLYIHRRQNHRAWIPCSEPLNSSSMMSTLRAYAAPIFIFFLAMFFQLFLLPRSFPPSHYDVLGVTRHCSAEEVREAYESFESKWDSGSDVPTASNFIKIRYAYELLTNPIWKRDYDLYDVDEKAHVIEELERQYAAEDFAKIKLPLLEVVSYEPQSERFIKITSQDFASKLQDSKPLLIQMYSSGSSRSAQFSQVWERIVELLEGVANHGMVELGDLQLVTYLAEKKPTGKVFFRKGLPSLVAFPPHCKTSDCLIRFEGEPSAEAVTDWLATTVMGLPRIFYQSKETLVSKFLSKVPPYKVKVILFSKTGERATPFARQAAKDYWNFASFCYVLWTEEDASSWWNALEVESAPAVVFMKDPGSKPVVYHGLGNHTWFLNILEQNKQMNLPQLRSTTSMELGCDAKGYSRAGYDTMTWYCAILVGRPSVELNQMRETMCRVQNSLSSYDDSDVAGSDSSVPDAAAALKTKRLTFAWLDGEVQKKYCFFYVHSETNYETCGTRTTPDDVPRLLIVRYHRNASEERNAEEKKSNIWSKTVWQDDAKADPASQLVVSYDGPNEVPEITQWLSKMVEDGDNTKLPFYRTKTPELVPEGSEPMLSGVPRTVQVQQKINSLKNIINDYLQDPRVGPALLLGALLSTGSVWLMRSHPKEPVQPSQPNQSENKGEKKARKRERARKAKAEDIPPSITDNEPKDAVQLLSSDSDSD
ncbi:PREDICTED: uncharacterized protein LOC104808258 [Tarenaya hassleriana]|uniref:uncharacterized protein LOC104808258 n=1 Tax=Tarenaya hassleriana TaxID=28532 RepID=UPI0008FCEB70|nr:PREDICTED: uncharacterized protein LOC104808258 [Tarenaya hassleriana]